MYLYSLASYYLQYLNFNRGESKINEYFSSNEFNKAIKDLTQEGYSQVNEIFNDLANAYALTTPLNKEESNFINNINRRCIINKKDFFFPQFYKTSISLAKTFIYIYRENKINFDRDYWICLIDKELTVLKNFIQILKPFTDAVILKRFAKKLLEIFILKNIDIIELDNYFPSPKIVENYRKSLKE